MAFARRAIELSLSDHDHARTLPGWVFFDRGLVDAASALEHATGEQVLKQIKSSHCYNRTVFLTPPWREIYVTDPQRQHRFENAVAEYKRLEHVYPMLDYRVVVLPKVSVGSRADFLLAELRPIVD